MSYKKILKKIPIIYYPYKLYRNIKQIYLEKMKKINFKKYGCEYINDITNILEKNNIDNVFCSFGTLLGFVREKGLIPHDDDIDMGFIDNGEWCWNDLKNCMKKINAKLTRQIELDGKIVLQTYSRSHVYVDMYLFDVKQDLMYAHSYWHIDGVKYQNNVEGIYKDVTYKCAIAKNVQKRVINNINVFIPENSEEILEDIYGENWRIPDPTYNATDDKKNVSEQNITIRYFC